MNPSSENTQTNSSAKTRNRGHEAAAQPTSAPHGPTPEPEVSPRPSARGRWDPPAHAGSTEDSSCPEPVPSPSRRPASSSGPAASSRASGLQLCFLAALVLTLPSLAGAGTASSAAYAVRTDSLDGGGRATASVSYQQAGSMGGFGGVSTAAAADQLKHGYTGQLYDVSVLHLTASPTNLNEGATRALLASASMDDGSTLNLEGTGVAWSVVDGPIQGISAAGLATAGLVYQDTPATVRGAYGAQSATLGLLVREAVGDNFGLYAGDGVDDAWQVQYFGLNNPAGIGSGDPDGDGQNNAYEEMVGSVPTDPNSFFRLRIERAPGFVDRMNLIFSPRVAGRTYAVQGRAAADAGAFANLGSVAVSDVGPVRTVTDLGATGTNKYYRVRISKP